MFLQQYPTEQGCTWKKIRQRLVWNNGTKVLMHRKHEKFRRHQTDSSPRYIQTRSRECTSREVWAGSMVRGLDTQAALRLAVTTKPVTRTHKVTGCAQNWRTVKKEESISPGSRHVWMQSDRRKRLLPQVVLRLPVQVAIQPWTSTASHPGNELLIFKRKTWRMANRRL